MSVILIAVSHGILSRLGYLESERFCPPRIDIVLITAMYAVYIWVLYLLISCSDAVIVFPSYFRAYHILYRVPIS